MVAPEIEHRVRFSVRAQVVHEAARWVARPVVTAWPMTPAALRAVPALELLAGLRKAPAGTRTELIRLAGFLAEWVKVDGVGNGAGPGRADPRDGAVLYFHGGAFIGGGLGTHRRCVSALSRTSRRPVLSVAYRQYPATRVDGSVRDGLFAYRWLLDHGHPPERIVVAGDSAGGYLAFAVALAARDAGLPVPAGIVGISALLDWDCSERDALANLRRHDLRGLPPVLLQVAADEVLRCDSETMARRLAEAGVPCTLQVWQGQVHAFPVLAGLLPEAVAALIESGAFIQRVSEAASAGPRHRVLPGPGYTEMGETA
jgi:acetyl esterase/lipase